MTLLLRPYDAERDLETCLAIWREASKVAHPFLGFDVIEAEEQIVRDQYMPVANITVAESDARVVGFIALLDAFIGGLFVDPGSHRQGAGRALVLDAAMRKGTLDVEVYRDNPKAIAFYQAVGFKEISERPLDDLGRHHPLVLMRR